MYFETHIIVGSESDEGLVRGVAANLGFWCSVLNADESDEERSGDLIITTRDETGEEAERRIIEIVRELDGLGVPVRRYKVEHAILDSKLVNKLSLPLQQ